MGEYKKAVKNLDLWFSRYIRLRDSRSDYPVCYCVTCGDPHHPKNIQNGHYVKRNILITRWDDTNCNSQCVKCNNYGKGEEALHRIELIKKHGQEHVEYLESLKTSNIKYSSVELRELAKQYRKRVNNLLKEKNIDKWW